MKFLTTIYQKLTLTRIGIGVWGGITIYLAWVIGTAVLWGWYAEVFERIKSTGGTFGAVVAASGLAWSVFYKAHCEELAHRNKAEEPDGDVDSVIKKIEASVAKIENAVAKIEQSAQPPAA